MQEIDPIRQLRGIAEGTEDVDLVAIRKLCAEGADAIESLRNTLKSVEREASTRRMLFDRRMQMISDITPTIIVDVAGIGSAILIAYGSALIYRPAGFIVAGALGLVMSSLAVIGSVRRAGK